MSILLYKKKILQIKIQLKIAQKKYIKKRCEAFTSLDLKSLEDYFDTSHKYGEWALAHEIKRIKYLNDWSYNRGIKFTNVASSLKFKKNITN